MLSFGALSLQRRGRRRASSQQGPTLYSNLINRRSNTNTRLTSSIETSHRLKGHVSHVTRSHTLPRRVRHPRRHRHTTIRTRTRMLRMSSGRSSTSRQRILIHKLLQATRRQRPTLLKPLQEPIRQTPRNIIRQSKGMLRHSFKVFRIKNRCKRRTRMPISAQQATSKKTRATRRTNQGKLSRMPSRSPLLRRRTRRRPYTSQRQRKVYGGHHSQTFRSSTLHTLQFKAQGRLTRRKRSIRPRLRQTSTRPLRRQHKRPNKMSTRPTSTNLRSTTTTSHLHKRHVRTQHRLRRPIIRPRTHQLHQQRNRQRSRRRPPRTREQGARHQGQAKRYPRTSKASLQPPRLRTQREEGPCSVRHGAHGASPRYLDMSPLAADH